MAGRVEAVGSGVKQFKAGDEVFGDIGSGSYAEFACAKEQLLAIKPANCSYEEAAATPMAALTALQSLRDYGMIRPGQAVLINGASGGVGSFAVQFAKYFGAEVTAVCSSRNLEMARALGADHVIDYAQENFTQNPQRYDIILAANGYHSIFEYKRALKPEGIYVMAGGAFAQMAQALILGALVSRGGEQKMGAMSAKISQKDLILIKELLETGKIKAVIDRRYRLSQTADALRYLGEGHARGKIVITIPE
jgi:NADPH:quinone reductase-like Zn-dependent oxidoreductase